MTKMANIPIYGKHPFKNILLNQKANFGMGTYQVCLNDDPRLTLTYLTSMSFASLMHLNWEKIEKLIFLILLKPKTRYSH